MSRLGRTGSVIALPGPTAATGGLEGLWTDETCEGFYWPIGIDDPASTVERIEIALDEIQLEISIPAEVILAYLAHHEYSVRHTVTAIKESVEWRDGRQLFLNEIRATTYPRYELWSKCRRGGVGSGCLFGQSRDNRLVFYDSFGANFSRSLLAKEFSRSEVSELTVIWCEELVNAAVMNIDSKIRSDFAMYTPLLTYMLSKKEALDAETVNHIEESFVKHMRFANEDMSDKMRLGQCDSLGLVGIIDWDGYDLAMMEKNEALIEEWNRIISSHYPFLFWKLYHVNLPTNSMECAKLLGFLRKVTHPEFTKKSVFVGVNLEKLEKAELRLANGGRIEDESGTDSLPLEEVRRRARMSSRKREELEKKEAALKAKQEAERKAREEEEAKADVESPEELQKRLQCLEVDIDRMWLPKEYGGDCENAITNGSGMFSRIIGLSSVVTPEKFVVYETKPAKTDFKDIPDPSPGGATASGESTSESSTVPMSTDMPTEESSSAAESSSPRKQMTARERLLAGRGADPSSKRSSRRSGKSSRKTKSEITERFGPWHNEGRDITKQIHNKKALRNGERETVRLACKRGDRFTWEFELDKPEYLVTLEVAFYSEGYRGKAVKNIFRAAESYLVGYYPMYGDFVAVQKGKLELSFLNQEKSQRRISVDYVVTQESWPPDYVMKYLPPEVEETAESARERRHKRQASLGRRRTASGSAGPAPTSRSASAPSGDTIPEEEPATPDKDEITEADFVSGDMDAGSAGSRRRGSKGLNVPRGTGQRSRSTGPARGSTKGARRREKSTPRS